ncbi:MAG: hypothetical protein ACI9QL_003823 [Candidatus Omnitrophota bacterium]|jgi:hypothetical protein
MTQVSLFFIPPEGGDEKFLKKTGRLISQCGMFSESIIKYFDVVEHMLAKLVNSAEDSVTYRAGFESSVERLHRGVLIAIPFGTHAGLQPIMPQPFLIIMTRICAASVTVMDDAAANISAAAAKCFVRSERSLALPSLTSASDIADTYSVNLSSISSMFIYT